jgi:hypothetical protein
LFQISNFKFISVNIYFYYYPDLKEKRVSDRIGLVDYRQSYLSINKTLLKESKLYWNLFVLIDFQNYFRLKSISDLPLTLITLSFKTKNDMATWSEEVEKERDAIIKKVVFQFNF